MSETKLNPWISPLLAAMAGAWGGAIAGVADAAVTSLRLAEQIPFTRHVQLWAAGVALGSWTGLIFALVVWAVVKGLRRALLPTRLRERLYLIWPPLLAGPVIVNAGLRMFSGPRAARIPGRLPLSLAAIALGLVAVAMIGHRVGQSWERSQTEFDPEKKARARRHVHLFAWVGFAALVVTAWANANLLPRLYPWFHDSLAWIALAISVAAFRLRLVTPPRRKRRWIAASALLFAIPSASAYQSLTQSRQVRFALFDKTAALGVYANYLPLPKARLVHRAAPELQQEEVGLPSLPEGPKHPAADVILITIDALRHDHVGAYGYERATTPNLDQLARTGARFERAYTQAPHTSFAVTSMLTGKYYPTLLHLKSRDSGEPLTLILRRYGWKTAAFYPPAVFFVDGEKLAAFRDSSFHFEYVKCEFLGAEERVTQLQEYFSTVKPERAFVWLHLFEPHEPYDARAGFDFGRKDRDRYDSEIAYTDAAVGKLLAYLKVHRPGAIVIVSADHGEEFDEHGGRYHGTTLYEEQVRVPLLVQVPAGPSRVVGGQVQLVDLAPTILSLLDIPVPARMKGTDLGPWLSASGAAAERLPPAFAEVEDKRMVVHNDEKLICGGESGACQLFDLKADPSERRDLIDEAPERAQRLRARMERWLDEQGRLESLADGAAEQLPKAIERGRLGDVEAAADLLSLSHGRADTHIQVEAARLLAQLPPQSELKLELARILADAQLPHAVRAWLSIAAYAAGADVQAAVQQILDTAGAAEGSTEQSTGHGTDGGGGDIDLRLTAALALVERGHSEGRDVLLQSLPGCNGTARCRRVIRALAGLGDPTVVASLHATMDDVNARWEVVRALGQLRDPASLPVLAKALREDERVPVRAEAAAALAKLGGAKARAALRRAARREQEPPVQEAIREAVAALGSKRASPPAPSVHKP